VSELEPPNPAGQRVEDIPLLVGYFAQKYGPRLGKRIPSVLPATLEVLADYQWPGNVRELENVVERALILNEGPHLDLGAWFPRPSPAPRERGTQTVEEVEHEHILAVLEGTGWRVSGEGGAAGLLGMKPTTLEARMKKLGITRPR
jgi:formate hydrogenlyase transcriptional activator